MSALNYCFLPECQIRSRKPKKVKKVSTKRKSSTAKRSRRHRPKSQKRMVTKKSPAKRRKTTKKRRSRSKHARKQRKTVTQDTAAHVAKIKQQKVKSSLVKEILTETWACDPTTGVCKLIDNTAKVSSVEKQIGGSKNWKGPMTPASDQETYSLSKGLDNEMYCAVPIKNDLDNKQWIKV